MKLKKKAFFFIVDALIALGVLAVGFLLILATYYYKPIESQTIFFSEDALDVLGVTKVSEFNNEIVFKMWCSSCPESNHVIDHVENTLLEQIGEFYYKGNKGNSEMFKYAQTIAGQVISKMINPQFSYNFTIRGLGLNRLTLADNDQDGRQPEHRSTLLVTSKRIVYPMVDNDVQGPYIAEVKVWQ